MNGQNIKIAIRRITRNYKSNLLIFFGLVIGLTSCLVIYTKVTYELSFDRAHSQSKNIYRVVRVTSGLEYTTGGMEYRTGVFFPFPEEIKKTIPELQEVAAMYYVNRQKIVIPARDTTREKSFNIENGVVFTEPSFFEIFDFGDKGIKWLKGEGKQVLGDPYTAVITEEIAGRLFLDQDPIGKEIEMWGGTYTIRGVINDFPDNTDFPFKVLLSLVTFSEKISPQSFANWGGLSDGYQCYVVLNKSINIASIEQKFKDTYAQFADGDWAERRQFKLQPLARVHKESQFGNYNSRTVSSGLLLAITLIGTFIYLIACFNYSNFFLAETFKQKKQIALKLILGSKPASIFLQFLTESLLINFLALLVSLQLIYPIIKNFYTFLDIPQDYFPAIDLSAILFILVLLFAGGILAVIFSLFNLELKSLSNLLKRIDTGYTGKANILGKASVILQFIVAQTVIIGTLFIVKQIYFINHKELGYNTENIIVARLPENSSSKLSALNGELLSIPGIKGVSFSSVLPSESQNFPDFRLYKDNEEKVITSELKAIDSAYLNLYSFTLLAGQNFSSKDTALPVIVNREFLLETGFKNIDEAIGYQLSAGNTRLFIKGIVEDFHSGSLHDKIRPCVFANIPSNYSIVNIKLGYAGTKGKSSLEILPGDIGKINGVWKTVFPDEIFNYIFLNDLIATYYKSEYKALNLFLLFASTTIFLCILGILGLSLSMNERRTKEIGLRKVNGATITEVIALLNRDFVKWIAIAFLIATPVSLYAMQKWLQNFAFKTELSWWIFLLAGMIALVIALITVSLQSLKAATRNPVEALRYE